MNIEPRSSASPRLHAMAPLIGAVIGLLVAAGLFITTGNFVIAVAAGAPIGVTLAIALSNGASGPPISRRTRIVLVVMLLVGVVVLEGLVLHFA